MLKKFEKIDYITDMKNKSDRLSAEVINIAKSVKAAGASILREVGCSRKE